MSINSAEKKLLGLLAAASFFSRYDESLLSILLVQIQADLVIPEAQLGLVGSVVRLGALPAFAALFLADRFGRRRVLLATIAGYTLCTAATALSPNFHALVAFQFLARAFSTAELLLAMVVIVEEFRPENRGLGIGVLGTLAIMGHGLAMVLFGSIETIPFGWRAYYALGVLPLLVIGWLRRGLAETHRFEVVAERTAPSTASWLDPLRLLLSHHRGRLAAVCAFSLLWSFSNGPVDFFLPKFFQESHGWEPSTFATVAVLGGALGLTGQIFAGWLSDRRGRKPSLMFFSGMEPLFGIALYTVFGPGVVAVYVIWVFSSVSNDTVGRTARQEVFPTRCRATAAGVTAILSTAGSVLGLACESLLFGLVGSHALAVRIVAASGFLMAIVVWAGYPETAGRTLEEIAPDPGGLSEPEPRATESARATSA